MARILHLLPHPGGGGHRWVDLVVAGLPEHDHRRRVLAGHRSPLLAAPGLVFRRPFLARDASRADLVHLQGDTTAILARELTGGRPTVITTQGLHLVRRAHGRLLGAVRSRLRRAVGEAACTLCSSEDERDELRALCGPDARLVHVPNGVPLPPETDPAVRRSARQELGLSDEDVAAVFLGELEPRKGVLVAARASRRAREQGVRWTLLAAGDGAEAKELAALAGEAVRPLGFRSDPERLLAAADAFVLPSEREGLSYALLEAMAAGVPPVVCDGSGNPEAVGDAGIVVPVGDEAALTDAFMRLAADPDERARLGAAARARAVEHYSLDLMLDRVRDAFAAALAR
jgi:glycosyltransferase involved in cell wall biosynthesis